MTLTSHHDTVSPGDYNGLYLVVECCKTSFYQSSPDHFLTLNRPQADKRVMSTLLSRTVITRSYNSLLERNNVGKYCGGWDVRKLRVFTITYRGGPAAAVRDPETQTRFRLVYKYRRRPPPAELLLLLNYCSQMRK